MNSYKIANSCLFVRHQVETKIKSDLALSSLENSHCGAFHLRFAYMKSDYEVFAQVEKAAQSVIYHEMDSSSSEL
jgi:hypothetical protein